MNKSPNNMTDERKLKSIELTLAGISMNKIARAIGMSNARPVSAYLKAEHPEVFAQALLNGRKAQSTTRKRAE